MFPVLLHLGSFPVRMYGIMLAISFMLGWYLSMYYARKDHFSEEKANNTIFAAIIGSIIGARLLYIIAQFNKFDTIWDILAVWKGGMVAYGGYIGGILASYLYLRWVKESFFLFADYTAPSLAFGLGLTRIGCLLNGCCFGGPTHSSFCLHYPASAQIWVEHPEYNPLTTCVHPVPVYEALFGLALGAFLIWVKKKKRFDGQAFLVFVFTYAIFRFGMELLRVDTQRGGIDIGSFYLTTSMIISILGVIVATILFFLLRSRPMIIHKPVPEDKIKLKKGKAKKGR